MKYTCPYCNKPTTATEPHVYKNELDMDLGEHSTLGHMHFVVNAISCPAQDCRRLFLNAFIGEKRWIQHVSRYTYDVKHKWQLLPESEAKVLPDYIPKVISEDYYEACRIRDLSPKASATLSRRCLQGMIRDFWKISKARLKDEVDALEEKVDADVWESIDAVRSVGNIGAHMEKDLISLWM